MAFIDQRVLERLRGEYLEMPGMNLTVAQAQRLCGIEPTTCQRALDALVEASFLRVTSDGTYVRSTDGSTSLPRLAKAAVKAMPLVKRRAAQAS